VPAIMKTRLFGEPGEDDPVLPGLDASRSTDAEVSEVESWKVAVRRLAEQAQLVVLHAGYSPALHWEADLLVRTVDPQRVLIFVNPSRPPRILRHVLFRSRAARAEKIATWMEFSKGCDGVFPRGLPRDANDCCFIRFDSEWNPISVKGIPSRMFGFTPIGKRSSDSTALDRALVWFAWLTTTESIAREASRRLLNYLLLLVVTGVLMFGLLRPLVFSR
jgi:hypothetical protein